MSESTSGQGVGFGKCRDEALQLKALGNENFKNHADFKALQFYTQAILLAPYGFQDQQRYQESCMQSLECSSPSKHNVALLLYGTVDAAIASTRTAERDPLLAQCFGNRSAVLYGMKKYTECLFNIDQALSLGCPPASVHKLENRRAKCQAAQKEARRSPEPEPCGSIAAPEECSAYESDLVTVSSDSERGRHLRATRDLSPGEIILAEESFACVLDPQHLTTHCSHCFTKSPYTLLPCVTCPYEGYCSVECREKAWVKYHWLECRADKKWRKTADWMQVLSLRTLLSADPQDLRAALSKDPMHVATGKSKSPASFAGKYGLIFDLDPHLGKFSAGGQEEFFARGAKKLCSSFGRYILRYIPGCVLSDVPSTCDNATGGKFEPCPSGLASLERIFLRHLLQLRCNSHAVSEVVSDGDGDDSSAVETLREVRLGTVLLPTASLMNHSCTPSAMFRFNGNRVVVCTTKHVKKGEEINNSYGPQVGRTKTAQRRQELREKYFFNCQCEACSGSNPRLTLAEAAMEGLSCRSCPNGALVGMAGDPCCYVCCHCQARLSGKELCEAQEAIKKANVLLKSATSGGKVDLDILLRCRELQAPLLHKYHQDLARTNDMIAQVYASRGDFALSGKFLEQSCSAVSAVYGEQSIEFANELQKMAQIHFNSGKMKLSLEAASRAKELMSIHQGPCHPDCLELDKIIKTIEFTK